MNDPIQLRVATEPVTEEGRQAIRIKRFLIALPAYALAIAVVGFGAWLGHWGIDIFVTYVAIVATINAALYAAFVSGLNQKLPDPGLTEVQIMAATGALLFIVYHAGAARGIVLLWLFLIFIFSVFRLNTKQLWRLAAITWIAYSATVYLHYRLNEVNFDLKLEIFQWLALGGVLTWFSFMGGYISVMRSRMRKSEAFYHTMWETANDAVIIIDTTGRIDYANPAVAMVFGRAPETLTGTDLLSLLSPGAREGRDVSFQQFLQTSGKSTGEWNRMETRFVHAQGHDFPAEVSAAETQIENQLAYLVFVRDITQRKEAEKQLIAARDAAESSSRAKTQFLANISHEVRTPLTGMIGLTEILLRDTMSPQQRGAMETIHRSGKSLLGVLNDVIDYSRIETGELDIRNETLELAPAVRDVAKLFEMQAREKSLRLFVTLAPELPPVVLGDPARLQQLLNHLLSNAVKFTEQGEIEIMVHPEGTANVRFAVRDTGPGVPADRRAHIFDAFAQGDGSLTRRHGGSGLGLAIVRGVVMLMNGNTGFDSTPSQGSLFWFTVPLPRASVSPATATTAAPRQHAGKRVLLVEDNEVTATIAVAMLAARGIVVNHAVDGEKAVAIFCAADSTPFDLVLMDCQMPVMDGFEATRRIRAHEQARGLRRTPISAFTAHSFAGYRDECLAAGMDDFFTKPIQASAFDTLLSRWLTGVPAG